MLEHQGFFLYNTCGAIRKAAALLADRQIISYSP